MEGLEQQGGDVSAGSPPAESSAAVPSQPAAQSPDGQQPGQPNGQAGAPEKQVPFHQHPRFRALTAENRDLKQAVTTLTQQMRASEQRSQQQPGGLTPDQQAQYRDAAQALRLVMQADPELAALLAGARQLPQLQQGFQSLGQIQAAQTQQQQHQAKTYIHGLADAAGLPKDKAFLERIVRLTALEAAGMPDGEQRFGQGDLTVLDEAFAAVKDQFFGLLQRNTQQSVQATKSKTQGLPPAPRGGFAGPDATKKPEPGKEREYEASLHRRALDMLSGAFKG